MQEVSSAPHCWRNSSPRTMVAMSPSLSTFCPAYCSTAATTMPLMLSMSASLTPVLGFQPPDHDAARRCLCRGAAHKQRCNQCPQYPVLLHKNPVSLGLKSVFAKVALLSFYCLRMPPGFQAAAFVPSDVNGNILLILLSRHTRFLPQKKRRGQEPPAFWYIGVYPVGTAYFAASSLGSGMVILM